MFEPLPSLQLWPYKIPRSRPQGPSKPRPVSLESSLVSVSPRGSESRGADSTLTRLDSRLWPSLKAVAAPQQLLLSENGRQKGTKMNTHLKLALLVASLFLSFFVGAAIFQSIEGNLEYSRSSSFFDCYYYCVTVTTTVGYGHVTPTTTGGKFFTLFYALVTIPLLVITLADIGRKLANLIGLAEAKVLGRVKNRHLRFTMIVTVTLLSGVVVFLLIPGAIFTALEEYWTFMDGFYYAFVTLSTVGFGDLVAGMTMVVGPPGSATSNVYIVALSMYTLLGLTWPATLWVLAADYLYGSKDTEQGQEPGQKTEDVAI
ncbi:PREDICTED: potassium channel subfamily K member 10-like isoform X2 [Branchiostoma belcheri]|uniref:Potassium channel subfamily K member 10-like isoform X2 n=1 Tax=Branchiostoma belcheri TaxID=7741 RepID=A0A6P4Y0R2_BRABE|nr:PREDICTED: potassium channel subfamily K member 10-like isoform X2 [Branchiostoma belcheri]